MSVLGARKLGVVLALFAGSFLGAVKLPSSVAQEQCGQISGVPGICELCTWVDWSCPAPGDVCQRQVCYWQDRQVGDFCIAGRRACRWYASGCCWSSNYCFCN